MKKNIYRILIVVGQSLMLLYFVALFFQSVLLQANLAMPAQEQLAKIISSLMAFSVITIFILIISLVNSCYTMPRFMRKRQYVLEADGVAIGVSVFGSSLLISYPTLIGTALLWYVIFVSGYCLQFFGFRAFFKKRLEGEKIEKSMDSPEVKLEKLRLLHGQGYLSDEEMNQSIKEWTPKP